MAYTQSFSSRMHRASTLSPKRPIEHSPQERGKRALAGLESAGTARSQFIQFMHSVEAEVPAFFSVRPTPLFSGMASLFPMAKQAGRYSLVPMAGMYLRQV